MCLNPQLCVVRRLLAGPALNEGMKRTKHPGIVALKSVSRQVKRVADGDC